MEEIQKRIVAVQIEIRNLEESEPNNPDSQLLTQLKSEFALLKSK